MKVGDLTTKENIKKGILKRELGMVYGTTDKGEGKISVDMVWIGSLPLIKGEPTLEEIIARKDQMISTLEKKVKKLETQVNVLIKTLSGHLIDLENEKKEDF